MNRDALLEQKVEEWHLEGINMGLLKLALTHPSYDPQGKNNNQRLEFLGDAVLDLILGDYLYEKYPSWHEGQLTKTRAFLAKEPTLASVGLEIGLDKLMYLGKGELKEHGSNRASTMCDAFEAVVAAVWLSFGYDRTADFVLRYFDGMEIRQDTEEENLEDAKSLLQEYVQSFATDNVSYEIIKEDGPPHDRIFTAAAVYRDKIIGTGSGKSKKQAEKIAADAGLRLLKSKGHE